MEGNSILVICLVYRQEFENTALLPGFYHEDLCSKCNILASYLQNWRKSKMHHPSLFMQMMFHSTSLAAGQH